VIAYELFFGCYPFYDDNEKNMKKQVIEVNFTLPQGFSDKDIISLLKLMLLKDEYNRVSFEVLLSLPFLK
jgi:hypothetical protein